VGFSSKELKSQKESGPSGTYLGNAASLKSRPIPGIPKTPDGENYN